jgi:hypothetical protein
LNIAGIYNVCKSFIGAQLSPINITRAPSKGVQVGLLNIRTDAPWYAKVMPFLAIRYSDKSTRPK